MERFGTAGATGPGTAISVSDKVGEASPPAPTFEAFFDAHHLRLLRALYLLTGSRAAAEDVLQDAFLKVWQRWERVQKMDDPVGYLYTTGLNTARSRRRRRLLEAKHVASSSVGRDEIRDADRRAVLVRAMASLPIRQRAAIVLTAFLGYTAEEAAPMLGVRAVTVRSLAFQGRSALRTQLEDAHG
jgi:RNA polymerase sigma factor (sigma-70 family)